MITYPAVGNRVHARARVGWHVNKLSWPAKRHGLRLEEWLTALAALTIACGSGREAEPSDPPVVRRDSAGIRIVQSAAPLWRQAKPWRIDSLPEVTIGSAGPLDASPREGPSASEPVALWRVQAVEVLSDGRIVVADHGPFQVTAFDSSGRLLGRFLRQGEGPAELREVSHLRVCEGDTIAAFDRRHMLVFDSQGELVRRAQAPSGTIEAVSSTCRGFLTRQRASTPSLGDWGLSEEVFAWVDPLSQAADTVVEVGLLEVWTRRLYGLPRPMVLPWGTSLHSFAVDEDLLVVGYGRVPELRAYDPDGAIETIVRWSPEPVPITREDRRSYSDLRLEWLARMPNEPESRFLFPSLDEYPEIPPNKPLFDRILVDDSGGWWIRKFPDGSFGLFDRRLRDQRWSSQTWTVFDSTGVWLGDLTLPERFDLKAVARGRLFGVTKDALDVEKVQVFRIRKR